MIKKNQNLNEVGLESSRLTKVSTLLFYLQFGLTCEENEWKLAFVGTANGIALLVAIPVLGILSDR